MSIKNCSEHLREQGLPYPRTCAACGLGPCRYRSNSVEAKPQEAPNLYVWVICLDNHSQGLAAPFIAFPDEANATNMLVALNHSGIVSYKLIKVPVWPTPIEQ